METLLRAFSSIGVLLMLIAAIMLLKRIGEVHEEHGRKCSTLIVNVTLPALVFITLLHADFNQD